MSNNHTPENENDKAPFPTVDPIDFAGYIRLCDAPFYESNDILNADDVGHKTAVKNGARLALLWNLFSEIADPEKWVQQQKEFKESVLKLISDKIDSLHHLHHMRENNCLVGIYKEIEKL